jgi:hypothetical protein
LALTQTEFKDKFKKKCKSLYTKTKQVELRGQIGHTDIYEKDSIYFIHNRLRPPVVLNMEIIEKEHSTGHWGRDKTIDLINRNFIIQEVDKLVTNLISKCDTCQRHKTTKHKRYGLLNLLQLPNRPWKSISIDFIIKLPKT